ncbi:MAG: hypothetical protein FJZ11_01935 [Candidatus Omnitrophica bacterium]|nr:hypothetical protein [Candidatus Omnitrophota bacterium]
MDFKEKSKLNTDIDLDNDKFSLTSKIHHLNLNNHDFSAELAIRGEIVNQNNVKYLKCYLDTNYSLLDYKPFKDIVSEFLISKENLIISTFRWGKSNIIGDISLVEPYEINLYAEIKEADLSELAALIGFNQDDIALSGSVDGFLRFKGQLANLKINGQLRASDCDIAGQLYREILVKLEGTYPIINLFDSEIIEADGVIYTLQGKVNLAQINNFYSGEHVFAFSPKTSDDAFNWHKWTIRREETHGRLESEQRLKSGRTDSLRLKDNESIDMLGVEQTLKF